MEPRAGWAIVVAALALAPGVGAMLDEPDPLVLGLPWQALLEPAHGGLAARLPAPSALTPAALLDAAAPWHLEHAPPGPRPSVGAAGLADAVLDAYAAYDLPAPSARALASMAADERGLDPGLARATAALLGALTAHARLARAGDGAAPFGQLLGSAARIAEAAEAAVAAARATEPAGEGPVFQDPFGLVVVGGAGPDTYAGNTLGVPHVAADAQILVLDLGGDDVYATNAGAAAPMPSCVAVCGNGLAAAAVIDLGGNDRYETTAAGGEVDQWAQGAAGVNGVGLLWDLAGDDLYRATHAPTAGIVHYQTVQGSTLGGVALLVDGGGRDRYHAVQQGSLSVQQLAQGSASQGVAVLADAGGDDDAYAMASAAVREIHQAGQGAGIGGAALLVEEGGRDTYTADGAALVHVHQLVQGTGWNGAGFLLDRGGDDRYAARSRGQGHAWAQGLGSFGGVGALVDEGGDDAYEVSAWHDVEGQTVVEAQGAGDLAGVGLLWDRAGDDAYAVDALQMGSGSALLGAQGAAAGGAVGALLDDGGRDSYTVTAMQSAFELAAARAQGAGGDGGVGVLVEAAGGDTFAFAASQAVVRVVVAAAQGAGHAQGTGTLAERAGDDAYAASAAQAGETVVRALRGAAELGAGLFTDLGGTDTYAGAGGDGATWTQGTLGVGADR